MDVAVIGAGPYGLSVAANLTIAGLQTQIYGRPMETWREHMPQGMVLKSDGFASNFGRLPLTLKRFCQSQNLPYADIGHRTPINDIIAYADFIRKTYLEVQEQQVLKLQPEKNGFRLHFFNGESDHARRVVLATGLTNLQRMPSVPGLPDDRLSHVSQFNSFERFREKRVLVLGGGQSAFESAALMHEQGAQVTVLSRRPPLWFSPDSEGTPSHYRRIRHPNWGLGPGWRAYFWSEQPYAFSFLPSDLRLEKAYRTFGPAGSGWLYHRVVGRIDVHSAAITGASVGSNGVIVKTDDGNHEVDHVVAATGYEPDIRRWRFLDSVLGDIRTVAGGVPILNRYYETSIPGLHVVGMLAAFTMGPSQRFIYGTNFAAPHLARAIKKTAARNSVGIAKEQKEAEHAV